MNTATVSMAVTPTILSTFLSHYLNRKPLKQRPTAHLSYDEGLHLIRSFLSFSSNHALEDLQAFTAQWVPHPQWIKVEEVEIPEDKLAQSANALIEQLGPDGIRRVGGRNWWQWRQPNRPLKAEWIEMRSDYNERKKLNDLGKRIMLYIHGGAYYFGSIDEHRYQMQRHARKLKARVFAPEYRLAPQFPFPCGLQDSIAAYLYLLETHDPTTIIFAGDSAGGGMVLSMLVTLRDRGIPMPAGAILISPWVDLTHSFPSLSADCPLDYIPPCGFHHKPSDVWPPLNADELAQLKEQMAKNTSPGQTKLMKPESAETNCLSQKPPEPGAERLLGDGPPTESLAETTYLSIHLDGKEVQLKDQIQMYTTNELLSHPLVSPVLQPTLGGLPPLMITTGGGEILRDEQIYVAHKCANPAAYPPGDAFMDDRAREQLARFKPTDVQLQIWDDLCHVAPTLSFTRPAKFMYRSIAQFGAWALARAQKTEIEILDDSSISVVSNSGSDSEEHGIKEKDDGDDDLPESDQPQVGKAGDPLPPFKDHMIRQRVSRHGVIRPLEPESELPACQLPPNEIGVVKEGPVRKWLETRRQWDNRYGSLRAKVHKRRLKEMMAGYEVFEGETPPPSALAGRRKIGDGVAGRKRKKSAGLALWSLWGAKHDEATYHREQKADRAPGVRVATTEEGEGAREPADIQKQERNIFRKNIAVGRSRSRTKFVKDEHQILDEDDVDENTPVAELIAKRKEKGKQLENPLPYPTGLSPPNTGVAGKRPIIGGIAVPFSLKKEAETASMLTLISAADQPSRATSPRQSQEISLSAIAAGSSSALGEKATEQQDDDNYSDTETPITSSVYATPLPLGISEGKGYVEGSYVQGNGPIVTADGDTIASGRPPLESFSTAAEDLPKAQS
ncbi:hypothetical protein F4809DRAFT_359043 [Biscogniauxia mediterranea]|nr:hypothetical protein F4809DRAFT_359043 [Biscogniauxia mediterranea]